MSKFCSKCGNKVEDNIAFCDKCGNPMEEDSNNMNNNNNGNGKSKMAAGLLGIFLGALGVHNFYLGYTGKAVAQLLLTLLLSWITCGISAIIAEIWGLIEGIVILSSNNYKDAKGNPLV